MCDGEHRRKCVMLVLLKKRQLHTPNQKLRKKIAMAEAAAAAASTEQNNNNLNGKLMWNNNE